MKQYEIDWNKVFIAIGVVIFWATMISMIFSSCGCDSKEVNTETVRVYDRNNKLIIEAKYGDYQITEGYAEYKEVKIDGQQYMAIPMDVVNGD